VNYLKDLFKQIPGRLFVNIIWFLLTSLASTIAIFVTSILYGSGFDIQYLIVAIPVFLLTAIISWLVFRRMSIESYTFGNTCKEYIINADGTATHNTHFEVRPNMQIHDRPVIKGLLDDLPGWSDPIINHDISLLGSSVDKSYPCRYFIWLTALPTPGQPYTCNISREYTNTSEKPKPYTSWRVRRRRRSITLFVAIHKNLAFDKNKVIFVITTPKGRNETVIPPITKDESDYYVKCNNNSNAQINSANYHIFTRTIKTPPDGNKYSIEWTWDV